jgi:hypothetical protein
MNGKPLFYMLANHGPWAYHVKIKGSKVCDEVLEWLVAQGKTDPRDYEIINITQPTMDIKTFVGVTSPMGKRIRLPRTNTNVLETVFFFNDSSLATYIKLTWGNR